VANFGVIGPYFFEDEVTSVRYVEMLRISSPELSRRIELSIIWLQQDGATVHKGHRATVSMEVVREMFPKHDISLRGELPLRNVICVGYAERTSVGNTECSSVCIPSVELA
jgi:hypothetical protein